MPEKHPTTTRSSSPVDYDSLARWVESDAGANALAVALSQPTTAAEKVLTAEHDAVLRRTLADHLEDPGQGQ